MAQAPFYLGVCLLFLGQNEEAARYLKDSANIADSSFAPDASGYLALANHRLGKDDLASSLLDQLCQAGGQKSGRACQGAKELGVRR